MLGVLRRKVASGAASAPVERLNSIYFMRIMYGDMLCILCGYMCYFLEQTLGKSLRRIQPGAATPRVCCAAGEEVITI